MSLGSLSGHYIEGSLGRIFVLARRPVQASGCILIVPPVAEEMNKSRRMMAEVSIRLAAAGLASVIPDFYGTGDSPGDFSDADWSQWRADLHHVTNWAAVSIAPFTGLLAIRLGSALVADAIAQGFSHQFSRTVVWQPVFDGHRFLSQFLRLRTAASLMEDRKESVSDLRMRLACGETLEVAGYPLGGRLAADIDGLSVPDHLPAGLGNIIWMELLRDQTGSLSVPSSRLIEGTKASGGEIEGQTFVGEPFWTSTEIVLNHAMIQATVTHFLGVQSLNA